MVLQSSVLEKEAQNPTKDSAQKTSIEVSELHKSRWPTFSPGVKLWKVWQGSAEVTQAIKKQTTTLP